MTPDPSSPLPVLSDEQVDAVYSEAYASRLDRQNFCWRRLRAAFPAPKPPAPVWDCTGLCGEDVLVRIDGQTERLVHVGVAGEWANITPDQARAMASTLVACADWVEADDA